jgi:hypothetical protein
MSETLSLYSFPRAATIFAISTDEYPDKTPSIPRVWPIPGPRRSRDPPAVLVGRKPGKQDRATQPDGTLPSIALAHKNPGRQPAAVRSLVIPGDLDAAASEVQDFVVLEDDRR